MLQIQVSIALDILMTAPHARKPYEDMRRKFISSSANCPCDFPSFIKGKFISSLWLPAETIKHINQVSSLQGRITLLQSHEALRRKYKSPFWNRILFRVTLAHSNTHSLIIWNDETSDNLFVDLYKNIIAHAQKLT